MTQNRGKCTKFSTLFLAASKEIFHANNYLYFRTSLLIGAIYSVNFVELHARNSSSFCTDLHFLKLVLYHGKPHALGGNFGLSAESLLLCGCFIDFYILSTRVPLYYCTHTCTSNTAVEVRYTDGTRVQPAA